MGVRGDFGKLKKLRANFAAVGSRQSIATLNRAFAQEGRFLVEQCFIQGKTPHGISWKPLKGRKGRPLRDSGRLFSSIHGSGGTRGFVVSTNVKYAHVQNNGAVIVPKTARALAFRVGGKLVFAKRVVVPARQFMPRGRLPASWRRSFERIAQLHMRRRMGLR